MNIWHLSDHKAGHVAQARGLFVALERLGVIVNVLDISVSEVSSFALMMRLFSRGKIGTLPPILQGQSAPDLIVGVGHATHWPLILLKSCFPHAKSVVLMRPTLPISWFDFAIVPAHDYVDPEPKVPSHVFVSKGVLNPLSNQHRHEQNRHLILIGGASKRYAYSEEVLIEQIQTLIDDLSKKIDPQTVILTTSRRTPSSFLEHSFFRNKPKNLQVFPVIQTPQGWLFEQLQLAEIVWVTRDSGSMLFEALTAGCRVGLLTMPQIKEDTVTRATDLLSEQRFFLPLKAYLDHEEFRAMPQLQEADRAASWVMKKLQSNNQMY